MIITLEQAEERINSGSNLLNILEKRRKPFFQQRTKEEQADIAAEAQLDTFKNVARKHDISVSQVSNLSQGKTGPQMQPNTEIVDRAEEKLNDVRERALDKLMVAMGLLDDEKLGKQSAKDLSTIAANLSKVAANATMKDKGNAPQVQIIMYAPQQKKMEDFKVVEVA